MAEAVTIDNYNVESHRRYAVDRETFDSKWVDEASLIPSHFEVLGDQLISSKWEELFETRINTHPFAAFSPPPGYAAMRNRFFSFALSPEFDWSEMEEEDEEEKEEQEQKQVDEYKQKIKGKKSKMLPLALLEKDRSALLNLVDSIQELNGYLREIHARKLQYQKG